MVSGKDVNDLINIDRSTIMDVIIARPDCHNTAVWGLSTSCKTTYIWDSWNIRLDVLDNL